MALSVHGSIKLFGEALCRSFEEGGLGPTALTRRQLRCAARLHDDCPALSMFYVHRGSQNQRGPRWWWSSVGDWSPGAVVLPALLLAWTGCSPATRAPAASSTAHDNSAQAGSEPRARARNTEWTSIDAVELPVSLKIPFAAEWRRLESRSSLRLDHAREQVQVVVRLWQTSRLASEGQCLTELGLVEPAFGIGRDRTKAQSGNSEESAVSAAADSGTVVTQAFEPSPSFRGHLHAEIAMAIGHDTLQATVLGVATSSGRCLVFAATTEAAGSSARQRLGERLEWIIDGMAKSVSLRTSDARVKKAPYPIH